MTDSSTSGYGVADEKRALYLVTQALRARGEATGARDTMVFGATAAMAGELVKGLDDSAGVIGSWMALQRRGNWWMFAQDTRALAAPAPEGTGDLIVMMRLEDADVLCTSLGMPAPNPVRTLARAIGENVPRLLVEALDIVDPPTPG
jgi:hypothetical protein